MSLHRSREPITPIVLKLLAGIAETERKAFFRRNPAGADAYKGRFVASALCQGAALHYIGLGTGVKDFDIHFFYLQHPQRHQIARRVRRVQRLVPGFGLRPIDLIWTVIPLRILPDRSPGPKETVREFLRRRPTTNARFLAMKAVVGLVPDYLLGSIIWPGDGG